jgi:kynureninase
MTTFQSSLEFAQQLDQSDPLASFRNKFHLPNKDGKERVYFLGNSLGLQPKSTTYFIEKILHQKTSPG